MDVVPVQSAESLQVPKRFGQKALLLAKKLNIINTNLRVMTKDKVLAIPLIRRPSLEEIEALRTHLQEISFSIENFQTREITSLSLTEVLEKDIPPNLLASLPRSLDIIGKIAIVGLPPELGAYKELLGEAILKVNNKIEVVLSKAGPVDGRLRLRKLELIAGSGKTETIHKEHRCIYHLDPTTVYFSPRLSQEHWRVAQKVQEGEVVIDMFTGVGPFAIQIGKAHKNVLVYAIDLNSDAIKFLRRNILANKVEGKVIPILGDAREVVENRLTEIADRVIMNLPEMALKFVDIACKALKQEGGIIHYYSFESEPKALEKSVEKLKRSIEASGRNFNRLLSSRFVRPIAPHEWQVVLEVLVH